MIADYLERLERELNFDRSLSRCVRQEVEDHLWEAVAADPTENTLQAQRRAIANFGDARDIAGQFAVVSLASHTRRAGVAAVLIIASVFIAMKARLAWYAAAQWAISDDMRAVARLVGTIDRYAFWLSVIIGLGGWIYIRSRQIPVAFCPAYRSQLLLRGTEMSAEFLIPIVSMTIEIGCVVILVFQIRRVTRRAASTAALQKA
jgi:hypothetical protein